MVHKALQYLAFAASPLEVTYGFCERYALSVSNIYILLLEYESSLWEPSRKTSCRSVRIVGSQSKAADHARQDIR